MGETDTGVFTLDQRDITGFTFTVLLTPVIQGEPAQVQVEVFVCCETTDLEYHFYKTVCLTEIEFPSFLDNCLCLVEALDQLVKQNSEERREVQQ